MYVRLLHAHTSTDDGWCKRESKFEYLPRSHLHHLYLEYILVCTTGPIHFHPVFTGGPHRPTDVHLNWLQVSAEERQRMAVKGDGEDRRVRIGLTRIQRDVDVSPWSDIAPPFNASIIRTSNAKHPLCDSLSTWCYMRKAVYTSTFVSESRTINATLVCAMGRIVASMDLTVSP